MSKKRKELSRNVYTHLSKQGDQALSERDDLIDELMNISKLIKGIVKNAVNEPGEGGNFVSIDIDKVELITTRMIHISNRLNVLKEREYSIDEIYAILEL